VPSTPYSMPIIEMQGVPNAMEKNERKSSKRSKIGPTIRIANVFSSSVVWRKSTIARTVARLFPEKNYLGASFFFKAGQETEVMPMHSCRPAGNCDA
jgi:hypothetical protein